jgi:type VI secretion system secreted protein Hcp
MQGIVRREAVIFLLSLGLAVPGHAAGSVFMSVTGARGPLQGDAKSPHGSQWIPIVQLDESVVAPRDAATGQASEKRQHQAIKVVKLLDASSPRLQNAVATREHLKEVVFQLYRSGGEKEELYETIRLSDVIISSIQNRGGASAHDNRPAEEITFQYEKIEISYTQQKSTSTTKSPAAVKRATPLPH